MKEGGIKEIRMRERETELFQLVVIRIERGYKDSEREP